ncbi:hypothetical protein GGS20DRAFT_584055 [Poronia punctata]|nr:hypothetical protein GGS20DRAFT_584055 [Poronia punctata]
MVSNRREMFESPKTQIHTDAASPTSKAHRQNVSNDRNEWPPPITVTKWKAEDRQASIQQRGPSATKPARFPYFPQPDPFGRDSALPQRETLATEKLSEDDMVPSRASPSRGDESAFAAPYSLPTPTTPLNQGYEFEITLPYSTSPLAGSRDESVPTRSGCERGHVLGITTILHFCNGESTILTADVAKEGHEPRRAHNPHVNNRS